MSAPCRAEFLRPDAPAAGPARLKCRLSSQGSCPVHRTSLRLLPLCLAIAGAVRAEEAMPAANWQLCRSPETLPLFRTDPVPDGNREQTASDVSADTMNLKEADKTVFEGNVRLVRLDQWLATDKISYDHKTEQFVTEGPVRYQDRSLRLTAVKVEGNQSADTMRLEKVQYQFNGQLGNGTAEEVLLQGETGKLTDAVYSTCPPGERQWQFSASSISINRETATGVARNATLKIGKVPVLWLPVISFPTDDKRRTGVLAPTIGRDDRNGLDIRLPVYLNLAPNYDATLTPRWLSKRGLMLGGEFRFLGRRSEGIFEGTYLPNDDLTGRDRSYLSFDYANRLSSHWSAIANLRNVSDVNYFSDFGDSINNTSISLLGSQAGLFGRGRYWTASLTAESWQIASPLLPPGSEPYRRLPRLQAHAEKPLLPWLEAGLYFEAVRFSREATDGGRRLDVEPYVRLPLGGQSWYLTPQLAWRYTSYSIDDGPLVTGPTRTPSRSLPIFSLDAGAYFERDTNWSGKSIIQTLEPRLFYLYAPYRNQDDLPLFDTRELSFSWNSLFRDNRFGGADRQSDANQLTLALTSRFLNADNGREMLSLSLGRITYFDPPRVTLPGASPISDNGSDWVAQASVALNDRWELSLTQQWDPDRRRTDLSSLRSQYRFGDGGLFNAAYRYRRGELEQTDLSLVIPVNARWSLYGRWNYSLRDRQTLEALAGFEWRSCCTAVRLLGRQYVRSFNSQENIAIYLEIELNGLGSFGRDTRRLLDDAILGYSR